MSINKRRIKNPYAEIDLYSINLQKLRQEQIRKKHSALKLKKRKIRDARKKAYMRYKYKEVTTADVLDWLGNENSFTTVVEILTSLLNGTDTLENIRNEIQGDA